MVVLLLVAVSLENADKVAAGLESRPLPYFLALVLGVVGVLWSALITVAWWGARGQLALLTSQVFDLKHEREDAQTKLEDERAKRLELAVSIATTAKGLSRIREDLDAEALKKRGKPTPPPGSP